MVWVQVVIAIVMIIVGELLRPKPKLQDAKPSALGEFNFPTADASRVIGFFVGTCKFRGMNTAWYGDLVISAIKKKVKTGLWSSKKLTIGYNYFLGVQMVAGYGPVDELVGFQVDDKPVTILDLVDHGDYWEFRINEPTLMDADEPPSGVSGKVRIYKGTQTQPADPYLAEQWGEAEIPAFRPLCYMVLEAFYVGNSETPPVFAPILRRCPNTLGLTGGKHNVNGDANIACVAYLIMTDMLYGLKINGTAIDTASFIACGEKLHSENLGISMQFDSPRSGLDWLGEVLRYADAVIYPDPLTGLYTMKMARADYDIDDLDIFDDDDIEEESFDFSRVSWEQTKNNIVINYTDRNADFTVRPVQYQDLANIFSRGNVIDSETIDFLGLSNPTSATVVATRAGKTLASPLARGSMKLRPGRGYQLRPGSVFRLSKLNRGIADLVVRVGEIQYGTLDDPRVSVTVTEDVFAVKAISYVPPTPTQWTPPGNTPQPAAAQMLFELPRLTSGSDTRLVATLVTNVGAQETGYAIWASINGSGIQHVNDSTEFTPSATLASSYPLDGPWVDEVGFTVQNGRRMSELESITEAERDEGHNLCVIGNELIAWREIVNNNDGSYTIKGNLRGVLDTLPEAHPIGSRVWFISDGHGMVSETGWGNDVSMGVKVLPKISTFGQILSLALAPTMTLTTNSRAARPFPPGNFRINTQRAVDVSAVAGTFTVTWAHRTRDDGGIMVAQGDGNRALESGATYTLRAINTVSGAVLAEKTGAGGTAATVRLTGATRVKLELFTVRGTLESMQKHTATFDYDPAGNMDNVITIDDPAYVLDGGGA